MLFVLCPPSPSDLRYPIDQIDVTSQPALRAALNPRRKSSHKPQVARWKIPIILSITSLIISICLALLDSHFSGFSLFPAPCIYFCLLCFVIKCKAE